LQRKVIITEEFGVYRLQTTGGIDTAGSLETALERAGLEDVAGIAEIVETLLGPKREGGGQMHTGQVSA
jgi:hypothetical protein